MGRRPISKSGIAMTDVERQRRRRDRLRWEPEATLENWLAAEEQLEKATWDMSWIMEDDNPHREAFVRLVSRLRALTDKVRVERWPSPDDYPDDYDN
jgi:hypothetical protein